MKKLNPKKQIDSAIYLMKHLLNAEEDNFEKTHLTELLSILIWKITEASGKHKLQYVSEGSLGEKNIKNLIHEHVFERAKIIKELLKKEKRVDEIVSNAIACLVTREEHSKLSLVEKNLEGWDRYVAAGIRIFDSETREEISLIKLNKPS